MARPHPLSKSDLAPLQAMHAEPALALLGAHAMADKSFRPMRDVSSKRLVVTTKAQVFHLVVTGPKWFDTDARVGGYGALDLGLHITGRPFLQVARKLLAASVSTRARAAQRRQSPATCS